MDRNNNIVTPFKISYQGKQTDHHFMDAAMFGESIAAAARIYTATAHFCVFGEVPKGNYKKEFLCFTAAPKQGSLEAIMCIAPALADGNLFVASYKEAMSTLFWMVIDSLKEIWTRDSKEDVVKELAEAITKLAENSSDTQQILANGLVKSNDNLASLHETLIRMLPELADNNRNHGRTMVAPIGRACSQLVQNADSKAPTVIAEPEAKAIKSTDDLIVENSQEMRCLSISSLNRNTGRCEITVEQYEGLLKGKITDPTLDQPGNVYTHSFDQQTPFRITAKPVLKAGEIHTLYISDARAE
ncbi:hypothetical protein [Alcanivorax sp. DP30]|uniref:DUF7947 five-stranded beta-barrel domain-containing protein n=1 Tax=Alcanivorax sp. DP30 TaxID=2606217 RepID=UPI00136B40FB|nr:hypothetical protein [Alcanivorax sp. DP30]MZR63828.1 hypothetical protein [Alcanivorax sp. DP30]